MVKEDWEEKKLGEVIQLNYGKGLIKTKRIEGNYPVFGSSGIVGTNNKFLVEGPGLIVGRKGNVGSVFYSENNFFPIDTVYYIKNMPQEYDLKFIYYLIKNSVSLKHSGDAAVPGLNRDYALSRRFLFPKRREIQQKIAIILSNYDGLIENNEKRIKLLEIIAKRIYEEWFVKLKFPGHESVKMIDSKTNFGKIPEGWEIKKLKDYGDVITGKTPSTRIKENYGDYMQFIKTPDINRNIFCISTKQKISIMGEKSQKKKTLPPNTLLVSCIGTIGVVSITSEKSQTNQQINSIILEDSIWLEFLYYKLKGLKIHLENLGSTGATMGNVNKDKFENIKLISPSKKIVEKYNFMVAPMFLMIRSLQYKNQNLRKTRDLLSPKLTSGEIDVSKLNIKIPEIET